MNSTDKFLAHFKLPKNAKSAELKNYTEMTLSVLERFKKISGKEAKKEFVSKYLEHYFDFDFEDSEMLLYLEHQSKSTWFKENPEFFSIMHLFPIQGETKIERTYDMLSHFKSELEKKEIVSVGVGLKIRMRCGPIIFKSDYDSHMTECFAVKGACFI